MSSWSHHESETLLRAVAQPYSRFAMCQWMARAWECEVRGGTGEGSRDPGRVRGEGRGTRGVSVRDGSTLWRRRGARVSGRGGGGYCVGAGTSSAGSLAFATRVSRTSPSDEPHTGGATPGMPAAGRGFSALGARSALGAFGLDGSRPSSRSISSSGSSCATSQLA